MKIEIVDRAPKADRRLRRWIASWVRSRLQRFPDWMRGAVVRLEDLNGPKGGLDKRISLELSAHDGSTTHISAHGRSYEAALVLVTRRAKQAVLRSPRFGSRRPARARG